MELEIKFKVTIRCAKYHKGAEDTQDCLGKVDMQLLLGAKEARNFIMRTSPSAFTIFGPDYQYTVALKYDRSHNLIGVCLINDEFIFVITNLAQFLVSVEEGYTRIRLLEKQSMIYEFDFESAIAESTEVVDEFEEIE